MNRNSSRRSQRLGPREANPADYWFDQKQREYIVNLTCKRKRLSHKLRSMREANDRKRPSGTTSTSSPFRLVAHVDAGPLPCTAFPEAVGCLSCLPLGKGIDGSLDCNHLCGLPRVGRVQTYYAHVPSIHDTGLVIRHQKYSYRVCSQMHINGINC